MHVGVLHFTLVVVSAVAVFGCGGMYLSSSVLEPILVDTERAELIGVFCVVAGRRGGELSGGNDGGGMLGCRSGGSSCG